MRRVLAIAATILVWPVFAAALDVETLYRELVSNKVNTVEQALDFLPLPLRMRYALVFDSRSLQQGSLRDPRVILFGPDARFVVAFNGDPSQRGYYSLEFMQYDDSKRRFVFREMHFNGTDAAGQGVTLSEPNPEKCLACHGQPARPVWDSYPTWPGVYGQRFQKPLTGSEAQALRSFVEAAGSHPRYHVLRRLSEFADPNTFSPSPRFLYAGNEGWSPNAVLTRLLGELNLDAIVGEIARSPGFESLRYALLATLSQECGSLKDMVAQRSNRSLETDLDEFAASSGAATRDQLRLKALRIRGASSYDTETSDARVEMLTEFRYLVERVLRIPTSQWTTALEKATYDFSAPQSTAAQLHERLLAVVAEQDSRIADIAALRNYGPSEKYCRYLRSRSLLVARDLAGDTMTWSARRVAGGLAPRFGLDAAATPGPSANLRRCAGCHTGIVAPELPFGAPDRLARLLRAGVYPRGSLLAEIRFRLSIAAGSEAMPRGYNLSEPERIELQNYFEALAGPQRDE